MTVILRAVGDLMLGDHPLYLGNGAGNRRSADFLGAVQPVLKAADVVIGNLETPLVKAPPSFRWEDQVLRGRPKDAQLLREAGFDLVSVANNHIMHHGMEGWRQTLEHLSAAKVLPVGGRGDGPIVVERRGMRIAFVAYSLRPEQRASQTSGLPYNLATPKAVVDEVRKMAQLAEAMVVSLHWGEEYLQVPLSEQRELACSLIDAGATLIIGHHPHVLQGAERIGDSLVVYSLGNFVSDMCQKVSRSTGILDVQLIPGAVLDWDLIPVQIQGHCRPVPLSGREAKQARQEYDALCSRLSEVPMDGHSAEARRAIVETLLAFRAEYRTYLLTNIWRYPPGALLHVFLGALLRRIRRTGGRPR